MDVCVPICLLLSNLVCQSDYKIHIYRFCDILLFDISFITFFSWPPKIFSVTQFVRLSIYDFLSPFFSNSYSNFWDFFYYTCCNKFKQFRLDVIVNDFVKSSKILSWFLYEFLWVFSYVSDLTYNLATISFHHNRHMYSENKTPEIMIRNDQKAK